MSPRLCLALLACVGCYTVVAMTTSTVPRRAAVKIRSVVSHTASDAPFPFDRSGYIVASS